MPTTDTHRLHPNIRRVAKASVANQGQYKYGGYIGPLGHLFGRNKLVGLDKLVNFVVAEVAIYGTTPAQHRTHAGWLGHKQLVTMLAGLRVHDWGLFLLYRLGIDRMPQNLSFRAF